MSFTTFISYSTRDIALATKTKELLEQTGSQVFLAQYSLAPGASLSSDITKAIKCCDLFILLWGRNSQSSEWVPQEIGIARGAERAILPVLLDRGMELPGFIKDLKYLAVYENPASALEWLRQSVFQRVKQKEKTDGLVWLGIGAAVVWLLSQGE